MVFKWCADSGKWAELCSPFSVESMIPWTVLFSVVGVRLTAGG